MPAPNNISGMTFPWTRHWVPVGTSVERGWQGDWFYRAVDGGSVETTNLPAASRLLILLGNPSTGKSTELELLERIFQEQDNQSEVLRLRATSLGIAATSFISNTPAWRRFQDTAEPLTLLIDGIDEALAAHPLLMDELMEFAALNQHSKLRFVLCLRSGAWDGRHYVSVFKAWGTTSERSVLELCPLRLEDVRVAFSTADFGDPQPFLEWLQDKNLGPTARIAQFFSPLIEAWRAGEDQALSVHQLRDKQIARLLQEDPRRTTRPGHPPAIAAEHVSKWESLMIGIECRWNTRELTEEEDLILAKLNQLSHIESTENGTHKANPQKTWNGEFWPVGWHDLEHPWSLTDEVIINLLDLEKRTRFSKEIVSRAMRYIRSIEKLHQEASDQLLVPGKQSYSRQSKT